MRWVILFVLFALVWQGADYLLEAGSCDASTRWESDSCDYGHTAVKDALAWLAVVGIPAFFVWGLWLSRVDEARREEALEEAKTECAALPHDLDDGENRRLLVHCDCDPEALYSQHPEGYVLWRFEHGVDPFLAFPETPIWTEVGPSFECFFCGRVLLERDLDPYVSEQHHPHWWLYHSEEGERARAARDEALQAQYELEALQAERLDGAKAVRRELALNQELRWQVFFDDDYTCRRCGSRATSRSST